jgi:hypothetical protein
MNQQIQSVDGHSTEGRWQCIHSPDHRIDVSRAQRLLALECCHRDTHPDAFELQFASQHPDRLRVKARQLERENRNSSLVTKQSLEDSAMGRTTGELGLGINLAYCPTGLLPRTPDVRQQQVDACNVQAQG